jgi:hypothetical protein
MIGLRDDRIRGSGRDVAKRIEMRVSDKPYTRWWWFNERIEPSDIENQLRWIAERGFGGVEIAWIYSLPGREAGPRWLSPEWTALAAHAKRTASAMGLGCDFTFGSMWPFADSSLGASETSQWYSGPSPQRVDRHWESRETPGGPAAMNHLDREALSAYGRRIGAALALPLSGEVSSLFCDSWEVEDGDGLWTPGFGERFFDRFGYRIEPYMGKLDRHSAERYDYRVLLGDYVIDEFFKPYCELCTRLGALSRVQCHGAPADIVRAYSLADIPESEALLFDPEFSRFAASAAALSGKDMVSCEAFTCVYGWNPWPEPSPHLGEEKIGDLKLLADALAAHGVNHFVWHGMPFSPTGRENRFYATTHVGPGGTIAPGLAEFNAYLEGISRFLREGRPAHKVACLLPLEDVRMQGKLPPRLRKPSARDYWEFQHPCWPEALRPWSPLWVSAVFLDTAEALPGGALRLGKVEVEALIVNSSYLDAAALERLAGLAEAGARIVFTRRPREPGRAKGNNYDNLLASIARGDRTAFSKDPRKALSEIRPFLECGKCPDFFVRQKDGEQLLFIANPDARRIRYPMAYGQSEKAQATARKARFSGVAQLDLDLRFEPGQSLMIRIGGEGTVRQEPCGLGVGKTNGQ